jgi:hypothetical protein
MKWLILHLPPALHYSYIVSINILLCTLPQTPPNYVVLITLRHQVRTWFAWDGTWQHIESEVNGNQEMELVSSKTQSMWNIAYPVQRKCYQLMHTPLLPVANWPVLPAKLQKLIHFTERQNLVSAHLPSILIYMYTVIQNISKIAVLLLYFTTLKT